MARITIASLQAEIVELKEQLSIAHAGLLKMEELVSAAAQLVHPVQPTMTVGTAPIGTVMSTYKKADGSWWNKVKIGHNQYAHRPVPLVSFGAIAS